MPETRLLTDPTRRDWSTDAASTDPRPIRAHLWRPEESPDAGEPPVLLMSHGTGGAADDLAWLAAPLADAGFAVLGVDHHGNTSVEEYLPEGFAFMWNRPIDMSFALDRTDGVDKTRVGAIGFSLGGYTVAALAGARLDPDVLSAVQSGAVPMPPLPEFPDLLDRLAERYPDGPTEDNLVAAETSYRDPRVRAAFLVAPGIGPLVDGDSLGEITVPVAIRWGDADDNSVPELNALRYAELIGDVDARSVGADVGHYIFAGDGEPDPNGARKRVAEDAVDFFRRHLPAA